MTETNDEKSQIEKLQKELNKVFAINDDLNKRIGELEFALECRPDPEHIDDNQIEDDLFFVFETLINRLGYQRFQQVLDGTMAKAEKYYGNMYYLRVR